MSRSAGESTAPLSTGRDARSVPTGIKILAGLNVFGALLALLFVPRLFAIPHPAAPVLGGLALVFVGAGLVFTYGLLTLEYWGWLGTVVFNLVSGALDLVTFDIIGVVVSGLIVFYLFGKEDLYDAA